MPADAPPAIIVFDGVCVLCILGGRWQWCLPRPLRDAACRMLARNRYAGSAATIAA